MQVNQHIRKVAGAPTRNKVFWNSNGFHFFDWILSDSNNLTHFILLNYFLGSTFNLPYVSRQFKSHYFPIFTGQLFHQCSGAFLSYQINSTAAKATSHHPYSQYSRIVFYFVHQKSSSLQLTSYCLLNPSWDWNIFSPHAFVSAFFKFLTWYHI